jgi:hypothetical protein
MTPKVVVLDFECPTGCGSCCIEPRVRGCRPLQADGKCKHLGPEGCVLPRDKRPIACREYLCHAADTPGTEEWVHRNVGTGSAFQKGGLLHYVTNADMLYFHGITRDALRARRFRLTARKFAELILHCEEVTASVRVGDWVDVGKRKGRVVLDKRPTLLTRNTVTVQFEDGACTIVSEDQLTMVVQV